MACIVSVRAETPEQSLNLYWDNDGTFIKPYLSTDRHYTNGMKLVYTNQPDWKLLKEFSRWNGFGGNDAEVTTAMGYFFGQNIYTPDHISEPALRSIHDQVFAGWLYGGVFAQRATQNEMEHFELNLGVIGPLSQAEEMQRFIHRMMGIDAPEGWHSQLGNEFAADFTWMRKQKTDGLPFKNTSNFDSHIEYGFTAGSVHRNANLGLVLRWGYNLPNDFGPGRMEMPSSACGRTADDKSSAYLFTRVGGRAVLYDRFLSGLEEEPAVGLIQVGLVYRYKSLQVGYSQTFMTREYKEQPHADSIGTLTVTYYF
jgi:hypothetical protein